jgi:8-oxo-dGTP diphosphatase
MFRAGQRPDATRYTVIPRTLTFAVHAGKVLMIRLGDHKGAWAGQLNGIGGHIEPGEDPLAAAQRELHEEAGLQASLLRLVGVILIDVGGTPGIGLFVFVGRSEADPRPGAEGEPMWIPVEELGRHALVEDIPDVLPLALRCYAEGKSFTGSYTFDPSGAACRIFTVGA